MNALNTELRAQISADVKRALHEDVGSGDLSAALVPAEQAATATLRMRSGGVICGQPWFNEVYHQLDDAIVIDWLVREGDSADPDTEICTLEGPARPLLTGERTALNFLQTLSATATAAHEFSRAVAGTSATILDTRKTIPGLRIAQKYAVRTGGAKNHRIGLFDAIMIKENHIIACGGIELAMRVAREKFPDVKIIVEVETLGEAESALSCSADQILLDELSNADMREVVAMRERLSPRTRLEASGGLTLDDLKATAETGVDYISIGSLTKHVRAADLSMRFNFA